jgi:hypothetical protein
MADPYDLDNREAMAGLASQPEWCCDEHLSLCSNPSEVNAKLMSILSFSVNVPQTRLAS